MKIHLAPIIVALAFSNPALQAQQSRPPVASTDAVAGEYVVRIVTSPALRAEVTSKFGSVTTIRMGTGAIDHLPRGWATFVDRISASDSRGRPLGVVVAQDTVSAPGWRIATADGPITVRYSVDLSFAQRVWPPGNEQAGLWADSALFVVTKALFAAPDSPGRWTVRFDVPAAWRVSTPWEETGSRTYTVPDRTSLLYNTVAVGRHGDFRFKTGGLDITLALIGAASNAAPLVQQTFEPVLKEYLRVFQAAPSGRYMMTIFYGDDEDGEGFENSGAVRTKVPLIPETRLLWGNHIAHELLHMWLGHQLRGNVSTESQWFNEGITEFLSNRSLLRTGMIDAASFRKKMENNISLYSYFRLSGIYDTVSVRDAGMRKYRHRFGVYNGGWAVAFALDRALDERTQGRAGLDDWLRLLYSRRASTGQPWQWDDLAQTATEVAGSDMSYFFRDYVTGREPLPLEVSLKRMGMLLMGQTYAGEMYVLPNPSATAEERRRGEEYFR